MSAGASPSAGANDGVAPHYVMPLTVRFEHCDPAGLVFYPRYYAMVNLTIERFFEDRVGRSFHRLHIEDDLGVPTVRIETDFRAPSRLEDRLRFALAIERVGRSSVTFAIAVRGEDENGGEHGTVRLTTRHTLVAIDMATGKAVRWPEAMATRLRAVMDGAVEGAADGAA